MRDNTRVDRPNLRVRAFSKMLKSGSTVRAMPVANAMSALLVPCGVLLRPLAIRPGYSVPIQFTAPQTHLTIWVPTPSCLFFFDLPGVAFFNKRFAVHLAFQTAQGSCIVQEVGWQLKLIPHERAKAVQTHEGYRGSPSPLPASRTDPHP